MELSNIYYHPGELGNWDGRFDGNQPENQRWHQKIRCLDLNDNDMEVPLSGRTIALLGFCCDEGVRRNKGRVGSKDGPQAVRKALGSIPVHDTKITLWDVGDIHCPDGNLESAQNELGKAVLKILRKGALPLLIGGGHEITYGHYLGLGQFLSGNSPDKGRLGIVNFDAHFDNRRPSVEGASSGTGFYQIYEQEKKMGREFRYLALGIQRMGNTPALFLQAEETETQYIFANEFVDKYYAEIEGKVNTFLDQIDHLYLTIDLDVFAAAYAPGVSAPSVIGLIPDGNFIGLLTMILQSDKLCSIDFAELNPSLDQDQRTAKLAAALISLLC